MYDKIFSLDIRRIVTDTDLDGVVTGAILKRFWKEADVVFTQPGHLRSGILDNIIDEFTAICDLPYHPKCGLNIDHHQSNKPKNNLNFGGIIMWEDSLSAARIAYNIFSNKIDLSDLDDLLIWVDKLDSGNITKGEYLSENNVLWLGRIIGDDPRIAAKILESFKEKESISTILEDYDIIPHLAKKRKEQLKIKKIIIEKMSIVNRLAIVNFEGSGIRSNGYSVTAMAGEACDACIIIHGDVGASFEDHTKYPVSASFYTNSFLHKQGGIYDLTKLATRFDSEGGGHANACGCRIKAIKNGKVSDNNVQLDDIEKNLEEWKRMWSEAI